MNTLSVQNKPINTLTIAELELLVTDIVRRVIREEIHAESPKTNGKSLPPEFLATFGAWEDARSAEEIITDIYTSRTLTTANVQL
jgi:hypothetical protein